MKNFRLKFYLTIFILFSAFTLSAQQQADSVKFYILKLHQEINPAATRIVTKGLDLAKEKHSDYVILDLDTYGGAVDAADSIRSSILACDIPVIAFINNQAVSAGSLISIACDSIYMKKGSTFGAASVVNQAGELMPDKYQAFMKSMMRATAQATGRDPLIAERMVMSDSTGKVLSMTMTEAIRAGYCEGNAESVEDVIAKVAPEAYEQDIVYAESYSVSWLEKIILFLMSPVLQVIFLMMIVGGIYYEIQSPGIGLPLAIAILGAMLYFAPLYMEGMAQYWEIVLFIVGIGLLAVELFVIPGFGVAGISGIIAIVVSLAFAMIDNDIFNIDRIEDFDPMLVMQPFAFVLVTTFVSFLLSILLAPKLLRKGGFFGRVALNTELQSAGGFVSADLSLLQTLVGEKVSAVTDMRPSGKVAGKDGVWYDASVRNGMALKGDRMKVVSVENGRLYCEKAD